MKEGNSLKEEHQSTLVLVKPNHKPEFQSITGDNVLTEYMPHLNEPAYIPLENNYLLIYDQNSLQMDIHPLNFCIELIPLFGDVGLVKLDKPINQVKSASELIIKELTDDDKEYVNKMIESFRKDEMTLKVKEIIKSGATGQAVKEIIKDGILKEMDIKHRNKE